MKPGKMNKPRWLCRLSLAAKILGLFVCTYSLLAYVLAPFLLKHYEHHPELEQYPKTSLSPEGIPGDPLNVGLVSTADELKHAMELAGWRQASALKVSSDLKIAESVILGHSYPDAPVSRLYLFGRSQDVAFEKESGHSPRRRHHVRFWETNIAASDGRPLWIGSATFDARVGFSRTTGQLTHHIDPDVDRERDTLMEDLTRAAQIERFYQVTGVGLCVNCRNAGKDPYFTDGELSVGVIGRNNVSETQPIREPGPAAVEFKNQSWKIVRNILADKNSAETLPGK